MKVPSFMLKKLYASGSLEATEKGFQFKLRNTLATATITDPPEVRIDGEPVEGKDITFTIGDEVVHGADISGDDTFALQKGSEVIVTCARPQIGAGAHRLRIRVQSREWDTIEFEVEDKA